MTVTMHVLVVSGTWYKPAGLRFLDLLVRSAGGGGSSSAGGGGGAGMMKERIKASDLPDSLEYIVGAGGVFGNDGGLSAFGDIASVAGGSGGNNGSSGGLSYIKGGNGGASGQPGRATSAGVVRLLAGGGGGGGSGSNVGGRSGHAPAYVNNPPLWQWNQSASGGGAGNNGRFPCGGAGAGANGAGGVITIIEHT